jgi:glycosyltransferase involved in cell wall biosynthesis
LLGDCLTLLETDPMWNGEVVITIDGSENAYAAQMRARYGALRTLRFIGLQPPEAMDTLYRSADAILFPSLLETWGLPLTEARTLGLPILAADLPYAHESVGRCGNVCFFDPTDAPALADLMLQLHRGDKTFGTADPPLPPAPFARDWKELLELLLTAVPRQ